LGLLTPLLQPLDPIIVGWLMLPVVAGITLLFGILRKELALELLVVLGGSANLLKFMTPIQIFTFALVVSIYVPCIATIGILKREFGWKKCLLISFSTIGLAILIGGITARLMPALGLLK
jgi:ferrous iron transport protein B